MLKTKNNQLLEVIKSSISDLVIYDFPANSSDLQKGTTIYNLYISALDKLLSALQETSSLIVIEALFPTLRELESKNDSGTRFLSFCIYLFYLESNLFL